MSHQFQNKYRISSTRLQNWDYHGSGAYYITICTQNREHFFGKITEGKMQLSQIGRMVETEWIKTFEMRPDMNLQMDEYVVMPNHFHVIIIIGDNKYNMERGMGFGLDCRDAMHCVSTMPPINPTPKNKFGPQSKNLASIIRGFKIGVIPMLHL